MKKVIITGANGFIGTQLCKCLAKKGIQIIAVVKDQNEDVSEIRKLPGLQICYCELKNYRTLVNIIPDRDVDVFFHLAWVGSAGALRGDIETQLRNVEYSCDAVKACSGFNCRRIVFSASIMEYEIEAMMKTDRCPGINTLYSTAKLSADYMMRTMAASLDIEYIRTVISNVYGPGERSPRLINSSIRKMLRGERCAFSAGNQIYDFIYISDAAEAFFSAAEKGIPNRTYYIGSQNPRPLRNFLLILQETVAPDGHIGLGEIPFDGVSLSYQEFDVLALNRDTGFVPRISFEEGIRRTADWIRGDL